jgi:hypothetical protein
VCRGEGRPKKIKELLFGTDVEKKTAKKDQLDQPTANRQPTVLLRFWAFLGKGSPKTV